MHLQLGRHELTISALQQVKPKAFFQPAELAKLPLYPLCRLSCGVSLEAF
jgi:hypothetical protein